MPIASFLRALLPIALLVLANPAWGAGKEAPTLATAKQSVAGSIAKARVLLEKRRFNEALSVLRPLAGSRTVHADALFLIGLAAIGASQQPGVSEKARDALLDAAITALRTMLVRRPGLLRVRLELARAFFLKREDRLARRHFEQVLAGKPPEAVALNVSRFLNLIRARKRWSMRVGFALAPDSNIGAGSDERIIYIDVGGQSLPFRRNQEQLTESGIGVLAWAGGEYQYPLAERYRLRAGADVSRREYAGSTFDQMALSGHVGLRWLVDRNTDASLLASVRQQWQADAPDHRALGVRLEAGRRFSRRVTANARASWHDRRYRVRTFLDGPVADISLGVAWAVTPTVRTDAALGWGRERPESERWRQTRRWVQAGVTVALPWGFTVGGSGTLRWTDYEGDWSPFTPVGASRRDLVRSLRLSVHNRAVTLYGFSPQISVVREDRTTNAQLHDYKRTFGELRFVRLF